RARLEVACIGERLRDQDGTDHATAAFDQAAGRLRREQCAPQRRAHQRIQQAEHDEGDDGEQQRRTQAGALLQRLGGNRSVHCGTPQMPTVAASARSISLMATKGSSTPPAPYTSMFRRSSTVALAGLKRTPRRASGISAGITSALKINAASTAFFGLERCITFNAAIDGIAAANSAGRIAKYLDTSFASENVVSAPRVISCCLPTSTTASSLAGSLSRSTMLPASFAACVPEFIARPTSAWASAGASLVPSPTIATSRPPACSLRMRAS